MPSEKGSKKTPEQIPWRLFVTKPLEVEAVEIGVDLNLQGLPEGDFLIRNPDPLNDLGEMIHCPRQEFLEHYTELS